MSVTLQQLREKAKAKCDTCRHRVSTSATRVECGRGGETQVIVFSAGECPIRKWSRCIPPAPAKSAVALAVKVEPIPRERWGVGLSAWVALRVPADRGIGDTLKRLGDHSIDGLPASSVLLQLTQGCQCSDRTTRANALYPYAD